MDRRARMWAAVVFGVAAACRAAGGGRDDEAVAPRPVGNGTTTSVAPVTSTSTTMPAPTTTSTAPGPPVAADSPAGLASQIAGAERVIRNSSTGAAELARAGQTQQVVYGRLSVREEWQPEVMALVGDDIRPVVEANLRAVTDLARQASADVAAHAGPSRELPDWRIVAPLPASELLAAYRAAEAATGAPWHYLAAIHFVETRMGRIRGNSVAGAQGPMQFIPSTWDIYGGGGDINGTHDAILAAGRMLRANGAPSDMASALYSYNPSNRYVRAVTVHAEQMAADERAYLGYYHWQVYYGSRLLPEGFGS